MSATEGKKNYSKKPNFWIANRNISEIKFVRIDGGTSFNGLLILGVE
jgi:hypothetical protein